MSKFGQGVRGLIMRRNLNFIGLLTVGFLAAAGCAPVDPGAQIPAGSAYVRVANGGSLFGSSSATVFAGDVAIFRARTGAGEERARLVTLRAGAFERIREAALDLTAQTEGQDAGEPQCLDYGVDVIEVNTGAGIEALVSAGCPVEGVTAAQGALRRMLQAEIVE